MTHIRWSGSKRAMDEYYDAVKKSRESRKNNWRKKPNASVPKPVANEQGHKIDSAQSDSDARPQAAKLYVAANLSAARPGDVENPGTRCNGRPRQANESPPTLSDMERISARSAL